MLLAKHRAVGAFTIVESLFGMMIGLMVLAAACVMWGFANEDLTAVLNYVDLCNSSKNALDRMSQQIRTARRILAVTSSELRLLTVDGSEVRFSYDPNGKLLSYTQAGQTSILLRQCDALTFSVYQRTPWVHSYGLYPATGTNMSRVVQIDWTCSRLLTGSRKNTEHQLSAKVVIRNQ